MASEILLQFPTPTVVALIPATVPVKVGDAKSAFALRAINVSAETGFAASDVLFQLPRPTIVALMPETGPVKVGHASLACSLCIEIC